MTLVQENTADKKPTLDPDKFRGMLSVIDGVKGGHCPNPFTITSISLEIDRFTSRTIKGLRGCDSSVLEILRTIITSIRVPWFTVPRNGELKDQHIWDFLRSLRKKMLAVWNLEKRALDALRSVCLALIEKLPVSTASVTYV